METREIEVARDQTIAVPDADTTQRALRAIREFQKACRQHLVEGVDYGVIPGTKKPTLLKPGAEKIAKLLGLADEYEEVSVVEDWEKGFFAYRIRCTLRHWKTGLVVSTGLGQCNSREARYRYRWIFPSEAKRIGVDTKGLPTRTAGKTVQYRVENEDPYSLVNTCLKMAAKRALVAATLSAGRLSDVFAQDIEEEEEQEYSQPASPGQGSLLGGDSGFANVGQLMQWALDTYGLTASQVLEILGVKRPGDIKDLQQARESIESASQG